MTNGFSVSKAEAEVRVTDEAILDLFWQQFNAQFQTEEDCVEELYRRFDGGGVKCRYCESTDIVRDYGDRMIKCRSCRKKSWLTAGTFFHRIRSSRPWLAAICLLEHGVICSSSKFQKLVGIAYSSALSIFKKLTIVIQSQMGEEALVVSSSQFAVLFCKRSRETPAREHPVAEQEEIENRLTEPCTDVEESTFPSELSETERQVYEVLSAESTHFDVLREHLGMPSGTILAALTTLELAGLVKRLSGNRFARCVPSFQLSSREDSVPELTARAIAAATDFVRFNFHGISRKYLQNYLAWHWCQVDRRRWQRSSLLKECIRFRTISHHEILCYVSPPLVKMSLCSSQ